MACLPFALVACALTTGCHSEPTASAAPPPVVAAVTSAPSSVAAGDTIVVSCVLVDATGKVLQPTADDAQEIVFSPADSVATDMDGNTIAVRAGQVDVRCAFPSLSVGDPTGAEIAITPGPIASVDTDVSATSVVAGGDLSATCTAYDAFGNLVPSSDATLTSTPTDGGNTVTGLQGTFTRAGLYDLACTIPGAASQSVEVEVVPGPPATIVVTPNPTKALYPVGSVVTVETLVSDAFNNPITDAPTDYASMPAASAALGEQHFQYLADGFYTLQATVPPPTTTGSPLVAQVQIEVGGIGPVIDCDSPDDGTMLNMAPGASVAFQGTVNSPNGVANVTVNGNPAMLSGTSFSAPITTRFGINFADIVATDPFGVESTRTCSFLVSQQWAGETSLYADTIDLKLTQSAVDDGNRSGNVNSFGDMLYKVANSAGLSSAIDSGLSAANPLKPSSCDSQTCTFLGCVCWYSSGIEYQGLSLPGPQTVDLTLVNGGIAVHAHVPNVGVKLRVHGDVGPVPYDTSGWATFSYLDVQMTLDTSLSGGTLHASIHPGSVVTTVGTVNTSFSGVDGWIINNVVVPLEQGTLQNTVKNLVTNFVSNNFNAVIDGVLSGLNISTLGTSFNVPHLDGTGTIPLSFGVGFSSLSTTPSRMLVGLSSRLTAPAAQALPSLGVPIPSGTVLDDTAINAPGSAAVAVQVGVLNQALHALWRGGMFNATLTGTKLGNGVPAAAGVKITTLLPPVADLSGNAVELSFGSLDLELTYPGLFGGMDSNGNPLPPLDVELGGRATSTPVLSGNSLQFGGLTLTELHFSTGDVSLDASTNQVITTLLQNLMQQLVIQSLNNALPALPIPAFQLPSSLQAYGVGPGKLGLVNMSLGFDPRDFVLRGQLGIQ